MKNNPLYVVIDRNTNRKVQIHSLKESIPDDFPLKNIEIVISEQSIKNEQARLQADIARMNKIFG